MSINYSNIISAAELMKRIASGNGYDWANRNDDLIPFKLELEPKLRKELKSMNFDQVGDVSEAIYTIVDWNKYKKIYELQPTFADYLADTESAKVSCELWKRLPYESFYLYFGDRQLHAIQYGISSITMKTVGGAFVRVHIEQNNAITLGVELYGDGGQEKWIGFALNVPDGLNFDEAIDYYIESKKGQETFDEKRVNEVKAFWRPFFRIVMNACQYFSASNAEIKDIKVAKKKIALSRKAKTAKRKRSIFK